MATITRGVKVKPGGIRIQRYFHNISPDLNGIESFVKFMTISDSNPLTYLYILAQRAQATIMLDKSFTIAIPGLVHLENSLEQLYPFKLRELFDLRIDVVVADKSEGSLIPEFTVDFFQAGRKVAVCKSTYLARRKKHHRTKNHKTNHEIDLFRDTILSETWELDKELSIRYARVSGDHNPIHTNVIAARLLGFRFPIMHGWYGVGRIVHRAETIQNSSYNNILVTFKSPVYLPCKQNLELWNGSDDRLHFALFNKSSGAMSLRGLLS